MVRFGIANGRALCTAAPVAALFVFAGCGVPNPVVEGERCGQACRDACDQACRDQTALLALQDSLTAVSKNELRPARTGTIDVTHLCWSRGTAHVFGTTMLNEVNGSMSVDLTYVFQSCLRLGNQAGVPDLTYEIRLDGTITQAGVVGLGPSSTPWLRVTSDATTFVGTVSDPALDYTAAACGLDLTQDGNTLTGLLCGRAASVEF